MKLAPVPLGVLALVALLACGSPVPTPSPTPERTQPPESATLRVGMNIAEFEKFQRDEDLGFDRSWDPQIAWSLSTFEIDRCCLIRTLMAYNGQASSDGGAELRPDLASQFPDISPDGLTWTFHLKPGVTYAPPFADTEIVAADFVRSFERAMRPDPMGPPDETRSFTPYASFLSDLIVGAEDYTFNGATRISGLEAPDEHTFVVHLLRPAGDLGARLAMPAFGPLPAGATDGFDSGYGRHVVASGPYMVEGADQLNPSLPPDQQPTLSGYVPGKSLTLVRNPSWRAATDPLRSAASSRIEITQLDNDTVLSALSTDAVDVVTELNISPEDIATLRNNPDLSDQLYARLEAGADWIVLNIATPPFDDLHVRRALNWALNKGNLVETVHPGALVLNHAIPDAFENDLLRDYNPYRTERNAGSTVLAAEEMRQSPYDTNGDGVCDAEVCAHVPVPIRDDFPEVWVAAQQMARDFEPIGVHLDLTKVPVQDFFNQAFDPAGHMALILSLGWGSDYLNGSSWFSPLASSTAIGQQWGGNLGLIGASAEDLASWGYTKTSVESIDDKIAACIATAGEAQSECWAEADQYLMERIAPWIPLDTRADTSLMSSRVRHLVLDASTTAPSLGEIVVGDR